MPTKKRRLSKKRPAGDKSRLVHMINGKKYVLMNAFFTADVVDDKVKTLAKKGIIYQGVSKLDRGGFLSSAYVVVDFFVPEKLVPKFADMI